MKPKEVINLSASGGEHIIKFERYMEEKPSQPKLMTKGRFILMFIAVFVGSLLAIYQEWHNKGTVSGVTIGVSVFTFMIGLIILMTISWYANKPEKDKS
jgi:ABC-type dipeptide/oligopeptide/nickel transport system permease component